LNLLLKQNSILPSRHTIAVSSSVIHNRSFHSVAIYDCFLSMAMNAASSLLFRIRLSRSASIASHRFIHCGNAFA
jgi:hypothetical protein